METTNLQLVKRNTTPLFESRQYVRVHTGTNCSMRSIQDQQHSTTIRTMRNLLIVSVSVSMIVYSICCNNSQTISSSLRTTSGTNEIENAGSSITMGVNHLPTEMMPSSSSSQVSHRRLLLENEISESSLIQKIAAKLKPVELQVLEEQEQQEQKPGKNTAITNGVSSSVPKLKPHQFLHLHHMKTGGTSIDHMMKCAMDRLQGKGKGIPKKKTSKSINNNNSNNNNNNTSSNNSPMLYQIPYYSIHECSRKSFDQCLKNRDNSCRRSMKDAAVMSYCAGLQHLKEFGWKEWGFEQHANDDNENNNDDSDHHDDDNNNMEDNKDEEDTKESVMVVEANPNNKKGNNNITTTNSTTTTTTTTSSSPQGHQEQQHERIRAFTILRHPVDRVWSMYRFQTRNCYDCLTLIEIYHRIDTNTTTYQKSDDGTTHQLDDLCLNQIQNHQVTNLLTSSPHWSNDTNKEDDDDAQTAMIDEAITNMKTYFTVIGLTEKIEETRRILGTVFPWMNETLKGYNDDATCPLAHDNSSPSNNRCIKDDKGHDSHWDLPNHPDEETRQVILAHNTLDMMLYEAAVDYFELQHRAMEWGEEAS
jgi:hypothetical protein